jgi:hypothetical protein
MEKHNFPYCLEHLDMKRSKDHKDFIAGSLSVATGKVAVWQYETIAETLHLNTTLHTNRQRTPQKTVRSARRLLPYCQLPNKYSRHISLAIWNFLRYFKNFIYTRNRLEGHRFIRHLAYTVTHSVIPINSSLLTTTLHSSVMTTFVYNDTTYSDPFMTL